MIHRSQPWCPYLSCHGLRRLTGTPPLLWLLLLRLWLLMSAYLAQPVPALGEMITARAQGRSQPAHLQAADTPCTYTHNNTPYTHITTRCTACVVNVTNGQTRGHKQTHCHHTYTPHMQPAAVLQSGPQGVVGGTGRMVDVATCDHSVTSSSSYTLPAGSLCRGNNST